MEQDDIKNQTLSQEATTIGMFLKYTRQNQKKSVETVSKALCIRKIYIKAIEESNFNVLPPVPYGIGFIRSYAEFLGLNAEHIVQCYKEESMPKKNNPQTDTIIKKHTALTMPNNKHILIGISLILGIYFIVLAFIYPDNTIENQKKEKILSTDISEISSLQPVEDIVEDSLSQIVQEHNEKINEAEDIKIDVITSEPEATKNQVIIKLKGESWIEIRDNNTVYLSGIYPTGFEYEFPDVPNLVLSVGRYFNVDVFINGTLTQVAGPKKQTNINIDEFLNH